MKQGERRIAVITSPDKSNIGFQYTTILSPVGLILRLSQYGETDFQQMLAFAPHLIVLLFDKRFSQEISTLLKKIHRAYCEDVRPRILVVGQTQIDLQIESLVDAIIPFSVETPNLLQTIENLLREVCIQVIVDPNNNDLGLLYAAILRNRGYTPQIRQYIDYDPHTALDPCPRLIILHFSWRFVSDMSDFLAKIHQTCSRINPPQILIIGPKDWQNPWTDLVDKQLVSPVDPEHFLATVGTMINS